MREAEEVREYTERADVLRRFTTQYKLESMTSGS